MKKNDHHDFEESQTLTGHTNQINAIKWNGVYLVTASTDGSSKIWEKDEKGDFHLLQTLKEHDYLEGVTALKIEEDRFYTGYLDGKITIWDPSKPNT